MKILHFLRKLGHDLDKSFMFFPNYTKLVDLAFLYLFVVKSKINSAKSLPPVGFEPATLGL